MQAVANFYLEQMPSLKKICFWQIMDKNRMNYIWNELLNSPQVMDETKQKITKILQNSTVL